MIAAKHLYINLVFSFIIRLFVHFIIKHSEPCILNWSLKFYLSFPRKPFERVTSWSSSSFLSSSNCFYCSPTWNLVTSSISWSSKISFPFSSVFILAIKTMRIVWNLLRCDSVLINSKLSKIRLPRNAILIPCHKCASIHLFMPLP